MTHESFLEVFTANFEIILTITYTDTLLKIFLHSH